ncbi:HAD family phosphatase [Candidatus Woesearchaeota archaeon]|nr:HAD family phosphatase [Candidatus Woesearchaeota archaeon]
MVKAVLFDMDGVLVDSERYFISDANKFFEVLIPTWTSDDFANISGRNAIDIHEILTRDYGLKMDFDIYIEQATAFVRTIYEKKVALMPGVESSIATLKEQGVPIALASSTLRSWIQMVTDRFKLEFDTVVSAEDVDKGKPAPDIFLKAAADLNAQPSECIVIEDSRNGVAAAKAAGMYCIGFRADYNVKQDLSHADMEIDDLGKLPEIISTF